MELIRLRFDGQYCREKLYYVKQEKRGLRAALLSSNNTVREEGRVC
jgi:hypothetical protein